ncbi:MAG: hypothetical protein HQ567_26400 [Candidatus Nealsonbacteria bacterium]|nr:hypothetical protein [Candidatus Nealsonbacteria bacterium]
MKALAITLLTLAVAAAAGNPSCPAGEIGYVEDFSLAEDRSVPLGQLIPGTEDHFYYHALHLQNNGQYDKVDELLKPWIKTHKYTARVREILNRQALLKYENDRQASLEYIREQLGIQFNHQKEILGKKPDLPTVLDQKRIARTTLTDLALARYRNLDGFENGALDWLAGTELNPERRRHLLSRLTRPDYTNLAKLAVDDLNHKDSRGFGSFPIHKQLLLVQLEQCLKLKPDLLNQTHFVNTYLTKLHPGADVDWQRDSQARRAYLDRLEKFVTRLAPVHNSLKAHVLYHRLVLDRSQGIYDRQRLMTYLKLPRPVSYANAEFMKLDASRQFPANLSANYQQFSLLPPVGNDEPLVRSYLHHFFVDDADYKAFEPYLNDLYLKHNFAETKIVRNPGDDPQRWYAMLPAAQYKALKERIDLDFAPTNKERFAADEPVALDLDVKNVRTLIVKVFEINTQNFYRQNLAEVDTDVNLDGLVANEEKTYEYNDPPLRRVSRHFEFASLAKPGVYVVDFIGNGKSSRALVRKGRLHTLVRIGTAGHVFTVLDEANRKVPKATLYLAGHEYTAGKDGTITVPFSTNPARQPIVLSGGGICSLDRFQHQAENYALQAGMYVDRESLLDRKKAQLVVRPALSVCGTPVTLSVLEDVRLTITSTDHDGVSTSKEVADFKLFEDRESAYEFQVPQRLASIGFTLRAKVQNLSQNKKIDLAVAQSFSLNGIDTTDKIEDLHFVHADGTYAIDLLGKTGEAKPDRPVQLAVKHRDFRHPVELSLQTDRNGRVTLGALEDVAWVKATGPQQTSHTWSLLDDAHSYRQSVHGTADAAIELPYMGPQDKPARDELSLLELRGNTFVADRFEAMSIGDGLLKLAGLPPGDYDLLLKRNGTRIKVRIAAGQLRDGYVLGKTRQLEVRGSRPLQIAKVDTGKETVTVQLQHASKFARLHVFAMRYQPAHSVFGLMGQVRDPEPYVIGLARAESVYLAGRSIGDEYRYIIDRKYAKKYPGNMLKRPELLLNPWAIRKTEAGKQDAELGDKVEYLKDMHSVHGGRSASARKAPDQGGNFANLDFLAQGSALLLNLVPDDKGLVKIRRSELGPHQQLHLVAIDPRNTAYRVVSLPEIKSNPRDLRLAVGLDPAVHFTQQKQIGVVAKGEKFELADVTSSKFEAYDSLAKVYTFYSTLNSDPNLVEFGFILNWHKMDEEEKRTKYSKYACHELSFFISQKDPDFFKAAVQPYLRNKKDKTFLDRWLLGDDLAEYLQPWAYARLNVVERILLAQRINGEAMHTARHVQDTFDLIPPNVERFNRLFDTALASSALDTADRFGLTRATAKAEKGRLVTSELSSANRSAAPAAPPAPDMARPDDAGDPFGVPEDAPAADAEPMVEEPEMVAGDIVMKLAAKKSPSRSRNGKSAGYFGTDGDKRANARQLYRKLDKTQEWVENNYYKLPIEQQNAKLITVNAFWRDYADAKPGEAFRSDNLAEATRNFPEMMFALALLDLPAESAEHETKFDAAKMTLSAGGPMIVFHQEIKRTEPAVEKTPILVSQNFFRHGDRYRHVGNEKVDKFVTDEFLTHVVYGCQVVVTNPTSSRQKLDVLLQMPVGAIAVSNGKFTRTLHVDLQPYHTQTGEYYFYFPLAGKYAHYPVQVAKNERLVAHAGAFKFNVVEEPSKIDRESWDYVSQHGTDEQVLAYLDEHNLQRTNLEKIAFRMADKEFFQTVTERLATRHVYHNTLWSYAVKHDVVSAVREYLQHADGFVARCGAWLDSPLLDVDPVARKAYQHMEYSPLVNARAHQLGRQRQIVNERMAAQYHRLLGVLSYRPVLDDDDLMAVTYYMLLQDRIEEAIGFFARVNPKKLATRLQYDYFAAYLDFYTANHKLARKIAERYADHPVDRWRNAFAQITAQLDEIDAGAAKVTDAEDRTQQQTKLAASQPSFDFKVESKEIAIAYQNLQQVRVNYYLMDVELLFSQNPFVQKVSSQFSNIRPNATASVELPEKAADFSVPLPEQFHNRNVLVEIIGGGQTKSQPYYSNSMAVQVIENYGQVRVTAVGKPLPKVYVKVYAQLKDGRVQFYKDGYTDLRGRFDYTSLNTNELDFTAKFSLLVLSDEHGAVVKEAGPPQR